MIINISDTIFTNIIKIYFGAGIAKVSGDDDEEYPPPYERLPDNYYDLYPTSYYATHTHVPPLATTSEQDTSQKLAQHTRKV